ncbi:unnamed protein product [Echinostoma caproni]|uniref:TPR_REGION domain-containing protein n=1 Tax=Echinostoma caproni TaxID=27848 RepID=A0A183AP21_9TREM|nr:unnamed protein product [Echinostoma caproni]
MSEFHREIGNMAWRKQNLNSALEMYNMALRFAMNDEQKSFVYANRSLIWATKKAHVHALKDIQRALNVELSNYPEPRRFRLILRRAQCLLAIGRIKEARMDFLTVKLQVDNSTAERSVSQAIEDGLAQCDKNAAERRVPVDGKLDPLNGDYWDKFGELPPQLFSVQRERRNARRASRARRSLPFSITYGGKTRGWQLVATRDIRPGELIFLEKPYAVVYEPGFLEMNCAQCERIPINPIPCRACSRNSGSKKEGNNRPRIGNKNEPAVHQGRFGNDGKTAEIIWNQSSSQTDRLSKGTSVKTQGENNGEGQEQCHLQNKLPEMFKTLYQTNWEKTVHKDSWTPIGSQET